MDEKAFIAYGNCLDLWEIGRGAEGFGCGVSWADVRAGWLELRGMEYEDSGWGSMWSRKGASGYLCLDAG